jgi:hypothetical protein
MSAWKIKAYWLKGGTCPVRDWYRAQAVAVQAEFDATLTTLRAITDWMDTDTFAVLKRDHVGLGEIRFRLGSKPDIRRFRPVGIWPPVVEGEFILLLGCEKLRNGVLIPDAAFTTALDYKRQWERGEGETHEYIF